MNPLTHVTQAAQTNPKVTVVLLAWAAMAELLIALG